MHNHRDFKLMSRCITSPERANSIGLHPSAARAPLDGTTSLSPPPPTTTSPCLACRLMFVTCFVACGALNFWCVLYSPYPSWSFVMAHYKLWEFDQLYLIQHFQNLFKTPEHHDYWHTQEHSVKQDVEPGRKQMVHRVRDRTWVLILTLTSNIGWH